MFRYVNMRICLYVPVPICRNVKLSRCAYVRASISETKRFLFTAFARSYSKKYVKLIALQKKDSGPGRHGAVSARRHYLFHHAAPDIPRREYAGYACAHMRVCPYITVPV